MNTASSIGGQRPDLRVLASRLARTFAIARRSRARRASVGFFLTPNTWNGVMALSEFSRQSVGNTVHAIVLAFVETMAAADLQPDGDLLARDAAYCDLVAEGEAGTEQRYVCNASIPVTVRELLDSAAKASGLDPGAVFGGIFAAVAQMTDGH